MLKFIRKIIKSNLFGDSIYMGLETITGGLFGFVTTVILARFLTKVDFGNYNLFLSILAILSITSLPGLAPSITRATLKGHIAYFKEGTKLGFVASFIGSFILIILFFTLYRKSDLNFIFIFSALTFPFLFGMYRWSNFLWGSKRFKEFFYISLIIKIMLSILLIISVIYFRSIISVIIVYLVCNTLGNFFITLLIFKELKHCVIDKIKKSFYSRYALMISLSFIFDIIASNIERIMLALFVSPVAVAIYSVALIFPDFLKNIFKNITFVSNVNWSKKNINAHKKILNENLFNLLLFGFLVFVTSWFLLPFLINLFFGEKYLDAIFYSRIAMVLAIFLPVNLLFSGLILYQESANTYLKINTIINLLKIILIFILIYNFKIFGAILASLIANCLLFLLLLKRIKSQTIFNFNE